eukprot:jgi/Chrpa1/16061/Chrysochromulina_OHIO_Genome00014945-RA
MDPKEGDYVRFKHKRVETTGTVIKRSGTRIRVQPKDGGATLWKELNELLPLAPAVDEASEVAELQRLFSSGPSRTRANAMEPGGASSTAPTFAFGGTTPPAGGLFTFGASSGAAPVPNSPPPVSPPAPPPAPAAPAFRAGGAAASGAAPAPRARLGSASDDAADALADALFDAIAAARVPKGTLDVPVRPHARRLPSGRRGISRKMLLAIRRIYRARGALGMLMSDVCKEEGFEWSVCALTRSTGLSLVETLVLTAEARGEVADALISLATTFFSYSWEGTKLGDMLDAIERRLAELEAADGVTRYVWIDMFAASQTLLAGEFDAGRYPRGSEAHTARKEDTDHVFADAMAAIGEIL